MVVVVVVSGFVSVDDVAIIVVFVAVAVTPVAVLLAIVASDDDVVVACVFVCVVSVAVVIVVLVMVRLDVVVTVVFILRLVARIAFVISVFVFAIIFQPKNLHFKLLSSCISFPQNNFDKCYTKLPCSNTVNNRVSQRIQHNYVGCGKENRSYHDRVFDKYSNKKYRQISHYQCQKYSSCYFKSLFRLQELPSCFSRDLLGGNVLLVATSFAVDSNLTVENNDHAQTQDTIVYS